MLWVGWSILCITYFIYENTYSSMLFSFMCMYIIVSVILDCHVTNITSSYACVFLVRDTLLKYISDFAIVHFASSETLCQNIESVLESI